MTRVLVLLLWSSFFALSAQAADVERGRRLATLWCARCHQVAPGQAARRTVAPAFSDIPRRTALDEGQLALYLVLERSRRALRGEISASDAADLAAYIMSIKQ